MKKIILYYLLSCYCKAVITFFTNDSSDKNIILKKSALMNRLLLYLAVSVSPIHKIA
ncbi:MAG: hypothetical protein KBG92_08500 [Spirochaetes bacterium]|nr:hypothetical protein [Spirochaetota bacterium]